MRIICLTILFFYTGYVFAQEISPGATTSNQLKSEASTSVDFSTGLLNYSIPLFSAEQDGFSIPFSLDYQARGVRVQEQPGLVGLGWSLNNNFGSIVRIMRGSAADEDLVAGILHNPIPTDPALLPAHVEAVNSNKIDGESDIFVLTLQGRAIKFILAKQGNLLIPKPLQKTDVAITCTYEGYEIKKWEVLDGSGNYYEFNATLSGSIFIRNNTPQSSITANVTTTWYITRAKMLNNDEIKFVYGAEEYVETHGTPEATGIKYNDPLILPNTSNSSLQSQLTQLENNNQAYATEIRKISNNINTIETNLHLAKQSLQRSEEVEADEDRIVNHGMLAVYKSMIRWQYQNLQIAIVQQQVLANQIVSILTQLYNTTTLKDTESFESGTGGVFTNRLLRKILLRNGEINFIYKRVQWPDREYYACARIDYKSLANDNLVSVLFNVNKKGYLKDVQWTNNKQAANRILNFEYYMEDELDYAYDESNAMDYWGFYNGKTSNVSTVPSDPGYLNTGNSTAITPFWGGQSIGTADRKPVDALQKARSLKSVVSQTGDKVTFEYEANQIYSKDIDENILMGGLRIKSITINDGRNDYVTTYKYAFPVSNNPSKMRSTGRLNEWQKKHFSWHYYYNTSSYDAYCYSSPRYMGTVVDDNSHNGVLYHYVEEVKPDGSIIAYKFPEIHAQFWNTPPMDYNPDLDKALLAVVYYNTDGHIVKINRKKYRYPTSKMGNRSPELTLLASNGYFTDEGSIQQESVVQIKKEPEHYNQADMLTTYPNAYDQRYSNTFNNYTFGINPYAQIYLPNFQKRLNHTSQAIQYYVPIGTALLLKEDENFDFSDYNLVAAAEEQNFAGLPNERPYLFERLIRYTAAPRIRNSITYTYNSSNPVYPNIVKTVDSRGVISIIKTKLVGDYQLAGTDEISILQQKHNLNEVVEKQYWKSIDNGSTYQFVGSELTQFEKIIQDGIDYVVPTKKYRISSSGLMNLSSLGYTEAYTSQPGYTSLFWESMNLFKLEEQTTWKRYKRFMRIVGETDRNNIKKQFTLYNEYNGLKIMEGFGLDASNVIAAEFSYYQPHPYYAGKYDLFAKTPAGLYLDPAKDFNYLSSLDLNALIAGTFDAVTLPHFQIATEIYDKLIQFQSTGGADYTDVHLIPLYQDIRALFTLMKEKVAVDEFGAALLKCWPSYLLANQNGQYGLLWNKLNAHGINLHAVWYYIQWLAFTMKSDFSPVQGIHYFELADSRIYESKDVLDYHSWSVPKVMTMNISSDIIAKRYLSLYMVHEQQSGVNIDVKAIYANGSSSATQTLNITNNRRINTLQLDIQSFANYANIRSFQFTINGVFLESNCRYFAVAPANTLFQASVYLPNGNPFLEFDHNGQYVEYVYDSYGNLEYTKNMNNEIVEAQEIKYAKSDLPVQKMVEVSLHNLYSIEQTSVSPKIVSLNFTDPAGQILLGEFKPDVHPAQLKVIYVPAATYILDFVTDPGNYILKINGATVTTATTGITGYSLDLSNGAPCKIEIIKVQ